jgi:hypothetical protein
MSELIPAHTSFPTQNSTLHNRGNPVASVTAARGPSHQGGAGEDGASALLLITHSDEQRADGETASHSSCETEH